MQDVSSEKMPCADTLSPSSEALSAALKDLAGDARGDFEVGAAEHPTAGPVDGLGTGLEARLQAIAQALGGTSAGGAVDLALNTLEQSAQTRAQHLRQARGSREPALHGMDVALERLGQREGGRGADVRRVPVRRCGDERLQARCEKGLQVTAEALGQLVQDARSLPTREHNS